MEKGNDLVKTTIMTKTNKFATRGCVSDRFDIVNFDGAREKVQGLIESNGTLKGQSQYWALPEEFDERQRAPDGWFGETQPAFEENNDISIEENNEEEECSDSCSDSDDDDDDIQVVGEKCGYFIKKTKEHCKFNRSNCPYHKNLSIDPNHLEPCPALCGCPPLFTQYPIDPLNPKSP